MTTPLGIQGLDRESALKVAINHHRAGRYDEAEPIYQALYQCDRRDEEILYLLGLLCCDLGIYDAACNFLREATFLSPGFLEAAQQLAIAHEAAGRREEALAQFRRTLASSPDNVDVLNGYANLLADSSLPDEAETCLNHALQVSPNNAQTIKNLGRLALMRNNNASAEPLLAQALMQLHDDVDCMNWLGLSQLRLEKYVDAEVTIRKAITIAPLLMQLHNNLGLALYQQGRLAEAQASFESALSLDPSYGNARINLANTLRIAGRFDEARMQLEALLVSHPDSVDALNNLGTVYQDLGLPQKALEHLLHAAAIAPEQPQIRWNLSLTQLLLGDYSNGWSNYEARWEGCVNLRGAYEKPEQTAWHGEPLKGKRILLWEEQGFGDTIQFIRFAENVNALGGTVIVESQPELAELLRSAPGVAAVIARGQALPSHDYHCPLMSLPHLLGITLDSIAPKLQYLSANPEKTEQWRSRLMAFTGKKVGLVWAGNSRKQNTELAAIDVRRSIRLEQLTPLLKSDVCTFFSIQKGAPAAEINEAELSAKIHDFSAQWADFQDTAAFVANLDLVISVDTAVAHLAAALGKPVWLLNRRDTCWRWLLEREDSPWYPSLRQFRQADAKDWNSTIEKVADALSAWSKS